MSTLSKTVARCCTHLDATRLCWHVVRSISTATFVAFRSRRSISTIVFVILPTSSPKMIDDYLGPSTTRFFSTGYRRVGYHFSDIAITVVDNRTGQLSATLAISYPRDWSTKTADIDLRPHLSTVDAILCAIRMSEMYLVRAYSPTPERRRRMWVRKVKIRAGVSPEEHLDHLEVLTQLVQTYSEPGSLCGFVSVLDTRLGAMRIRCEIEHACADPDIGSAIYGNPEDLLGPAAQRYYGNGFAFRSHRIDNLTVNLTELIAMATVDIGKEIVEAPIDHGLEGYYQPIPTMVDCFVTNLQLGQVLMYEMDAMKRGESNTMWMRQTTLEAVDPRHRARHGRLLFTSLVNTGLLEMRSHPWRTADIIGQFGGVSLRCAVAHALPAALLS
jgi:hypothetical protein